MPEMTSYEPGSFCWPELATSNSASAKEFYGALFGWSAEDKEGSGGFYTMLRLRGLDVGALYADTSGRSGPPHWNTYISVTNADESAAKAKSLGGTVLTEPFEVEKVGRMTIVKDPVGATVCLWQAREHAGAGLIGDTGSMCWNELLTSDVDSALVFYKGLFGWTAKPSEEYTELERNGTPHGGMMKIAKEWGPVPSHWMIYFTVDDCDAAAARATGLGGTIRVPPTTIPNVGRFSVLADREGAGFAVFTMMAGHKESKS